MKNLHLYNQELVHENNGVPVTTSLKIAEIFGKDHDKVLRDIRNLSCSEEFRAANFGDSSYISSQGKELPMNRMTKNGFIFLVMGYTGPTAGRMKEGYIMAFDLMENALRTRAQTNESKYFTAKHDLLVEKRRLDTEVQHLSNKLHNSPVGRSLAAKRKALDDVKLRIERLERKQFTLAFSLFPELV